MKLMLRVWFYRFARDRKANVAVIFAIMMVPTIYLLGMALDYTQAQRRQSQLDAAADAAAIAAVTPTMMSQNTTVAQTTATNIFNATANSLTTSGYLPSSPNVTITVGNVGLVRTATVTYTAQSTNNFPSLLGPQGWPIQGTATASASGAPNINFYLLLDDSPSMGIGATANDISNLITATANQPSGSASCGFACHELNPQKDSGATSSTKDNLSIARANNVTLRIDLVADATSSLMSTAQTTETQQNNTYKAAIYTFDYGVNTVYAPSGLPSADLATAATQAANNIAILEVDHQNCVVSGCPTTTTDYGTDIENGLTSVNSLMPAPGGGTNQTGDTPQEVVFLVTDGVDDKMVSTSSSCSGTPIKNGSLYRCQQPINTSICTTIKNRGIRIAVLYTEYLQLPTNAWYNSYIATFNNPSSSSGQIAQNAQACASPGLFYDVQSGGDITAALTALFLKVVETAPHLTN
jgi:Flp pilus assembly protein TadG